MLSPGFSPHAARCAAPADDMTPWIIALSCWLILGCTALLCVPVLRGTDPLFGWLPFWLVIAPAIDLAVLRRRSLIARTRDLVARVSRRRTTRQAKRLRRRQRTVRRATRTRTAAR